MKATKYMAATRRRSSALMERRNRGFDLTWNKRNRLNDPMTSDRHCAQYVANARRMGLVNPKDVKGL